MKNWTIAKRISSGFALVVSLCGLMGLFTWTAMRAINTRAEDIATDKIPGMTLTSDIAKNVTRSHLALVQLVLARDAVSRQARLSEFKSLVATNDALITTLEGACDLPEEKDLLGKLKQARDNYATTAASIVDFVQQSKSDEAASRIQSVSEGAFVSFNEAAGAFSDFETKQGVGFANAIEEKTSRSRVIISVIVCAILITSTIISLIVVTTLNRILSKVSFSLGTEAEQITAAAAEVSSSSESLAQGASEQAASLEETSASLEEMSSMTKRNSENAQKANDIAKEAFAAAELGVTDMQRMSAAMEAIKTSGDDISKIIKTIDEIAFQTNILALNAAVEAARAGDAGMGFAVVAGEVRNLAQRSAQAAKETAAKIESAISNTTQGVEISAKVSKSLNDIVRKARQVDVLAAEVAVASREQSQGITQINAAMSQMDKVTQNNAAAAEESAAAAQQLNGQARAIKTAVGELVRLVGEAGGHLDSKLDFQATDQDEGFKIAHNGGHSKETVARAEETLVTQF